MHNLLIFVTIVIAVILVSASITIFINGIALKEFYNEIKRSNALKSAAVGVGSIVLITAIMFFIPGNANAGTWFNDAGVYVGLDYTKSQSPQCEENNIDNRGTSNLGMWGNLWQSSDESIRVNAKYTHHSCFLGPDTNTYDGAGITAEWKLWKRK